MPEEWFQILDGVAFDTLEQGAFDQAVEIHERLASEQLIEFDFACCKSTHQAFQRRWFIRGEMIGMRVRVVRSDGCRHILEAFKRLRLFFQRTGSDRRIDVLPVRLTRDVSGHIFLDTLLPKMIALKVEEDVLRSGLRQ